MGDTPLNDINPELADAFHENHDVAVNGRQFKSNDEVSHKFMTHKANTETKAQQPQLILIT